MTSNAERSLLTLLSWSKLPQPELEYRFCNRRWRFDFAYPEQMLAIEVDGGAWVNGRHSRGAGMENDTEKIATAMLLGWRVLRVTPAQVEDGRAVAWIRELLEKAA